MRDCKGLTLVEVIISIALLGIISLGLISAMATNFKLIAHSKSMTADVFAAQKMIEDRIEGAPDLATAETKTIRLRSSAGTIYTKQIVGYPLTVTISSGRSLYTFDSEIQLAEPNVPIALSASVVMRNDSTVVDHVYAVDTRSNLVGSHVLKTDTIPDWLYTQHRWYVSRNTEVKAFNPIIPGGVIPEADWGVRYPRFPEDYDLIPGETSAQLNDLTNYKGRHVIYAVRPVAKTGRLGAEVHSNPAWVIGLPIISGLAAHLDASLIPTAPGVALASWGDLSSTLPSGYANNGTQGTAGKQPILSDAYFGKSLSFDGTDDYLSIANHSSMNLDNLTVIAVAKSDRSYPWFNPITMKHSTANAWGLGWTADQGTLPMKKVGYFIKSNAGFPPQALTDLRQGNIDEGLNDQWHVFRGTATSSEVGFWIDAIQKERAARTVNANISSSNAISIGGYSGGASSVYSKVDIAEIIIYDGTPSESELAVIDDYLVEKYAAVSVSVVSSDASLKNLNIDGTPITGFVSNQYTYDVGLPAGTTAAPAVSAVPNSLNASVTVTQANLLNGLGTARIVIRAQNGIATKTYVVNFHTSSSDASIKSLTVSGLTLTPDFSPDITMYTVKLNDLATEAPEISAAATSNRASVAITQAANSIGTATILVTAEDGTQSTYSVKFDQDTRGLSSLVAQRRNGSNGTTVALSPAFSPDALINAYTLSYNQSQDFRVRPTAYAGTITVNGVVVPSNTNSLWLPKGTPVTIVVTEPGKIEKTYTIN